MKLTTIVTLVILGVVISTSAVTAKPGECPEVTINCKTTNKGCKSDDACPGREKCCQLQCGPRNCTLPDCYLYSDGGPCENSIQRWYFDPSDRYCKTFNYGGCQGNGNRFVSENECRTKCHARGPRAEVCKLPGESKCQILYPHWYYDSKKGYCRRVAYGGCEEDRNRFSTELDCRQTCNATVAKKPGQCPPPTKPTKGSTNCTVDCKSDYDCLKSEKCCSVGCGVKCAKAQFSKKCPAIPDLSCFVQDDDKCVTDADCNGKFCCPTQCAGTKCI